MKLLSSLKSNTIKTFKPRGNKEFFNNPILKIIQKAMKKYLWNYFYTKRRMKLSWKITHAINLQLPKKEN